MLLVLLLTLYLDMNQQKYNNQLPFIVKSVWSINNRIKLTFKQIR